MNTGTIAAIAIIAAAIIIIYLLSSYNSFIKLKNSVEEAFATMDVYLKKRWDLIPNIVASVKGYAKHEAETLEGIVKARSGGYHGLSAEDKLEANAELSRGISGIFALAEQYPDLKANQNFLELNNELQQAEKDIANARKYYNAVVKKYNNMAEMFPTNIIAKMFHFEKKQMFVVDDAIERSNVKVEF